MGMNVCVPMCIFVHVVQGGDVHEENKPNNEVENLSQVKLEKQKGQKYFSECSFRH